MKRQSGKLCAGNGLRRVCLLFVSLTAAFGVAFGPYAYAQTSAASGAAPGTGTTTSSTYTQSGSTTSTTTTATPAATLSGSSAPSAAAPASAPPAGALLNDFAPVSTINVTAGGPDPEFSALEAKYNARFPNNAPLVGSTAWHGFLQQLDRSIEITLPAPETISSVSIQMNQNPNIGVLFPDHVSFEVRHNGTWYLAQSVKSLIPPWTMSQNTEVFTANFNDIQAQRIIIHFPVAGWVFANEIHVWGYNNVAPNPFPSLPQVPQTTGTAMTTRNARDHGIQNMLLVYTGGGTAASTWTQHDFMPMVGYMTPAGKITGRMFDTMLFLPEGRLANTQTAWQGYLNNLFASGSQLSALNQAVALTNWELPGAGSLQYKEKVIIGIPHPRFGSGVWGTLNGTQLNFSGTYNDTYAVQSRIAALQWYVNTLLQKWRAAHFGDLKLAGFYWVDEKVDFHQPDDLNLIQATATYTRSQGFPLFWIPYYDAAGIDGWQSHGFTAAWMQPNYLDQGNTDPQRLQVAVQLAQTTGMGIEIEAPWEVVSVPNYRTLYLQMLTTLEQDQMASPVSHAFYAGSKVLVTAAYSKYAPDRNVYNATYKFIHFK